MRQLIQQIYGFLVSSPGSFIYHVILVLCIIGVLLVASRSLKSSRNQKRMVVGLSILLGVQVLIFLLGFITWMGWLGEFRILPALDRWVGFMILIWMAWLWVFPEPKKLADIFSVLVSLVGFLYLIFCGIFSARFPMGMFTASGWETGWQTGSLMLVFIGLLLLMVRRPAGWGNGFVVLILALLGHLVSLVWRVEGDFPGYLRLVHLAMFPFLFTLLRPQPAGTQVFPQSNIVSKTGEQVPAWEERRLYSADASTFQSLLKLAGENSIEEICPTLVRAVAQTMLADMASFMVTGENENLAVPCTYDLVHDKYLPGINLIKESIPRLSTAFLQSQPLMISALDNSADKDLLCQVFNLDNAGSLLYIPIPASGRDPIGGILLLSPYSAREWTEKDQEYLEQASVYWQPLVERGDKFSSLINERDFARMEAQNKQVELLQSKKQLDQEAFFPGEQVNHGTVRSSLQADRLASMTAMHAEAQRKIEQLYSDIDQLRLENEQLRQVGIPQPGTTDELDSNLHQSLEQVVNLQNSLVGMDQKMTEAQQESQQDTTGEKLGELSLIARDLEEPMTSIVDYTDLLMSESIGTLGPLQKKYVDKVRTSTEILGSLVNDLVQITRLDTGRLEVNPELVELNLVVDNVMGVAGNRLREKNLTLRLDIPEVPSHVIIDGMVLQQILIQLMRNATSASPVDGVVTLRMQVKEQEGKPQLIVQVTDTGEGIASGDIPLAFTRRYGTEQAQITGVGDTGVGLSIVKSLVEIQGGSFWVDTQEKNGSTFNVVLPVELVGTEN